MSDRDPAKAFDDGATKAGLTLDSHDHKAGADDELGTGPRGKSVFDSKGAVGKQFTTDGILGGTAQKVGGPLDKEGIIGKAFTEKGTIGGTVQNLLSSKK